MQQRPPDALGADRVGNDALFQALARKLPGVSSSQQVDKIAKDIQGVLKSYNQLYAHTSSFFNVDNGTEELRICVKGLVTTTFKGNSYQTPIIIWIGSRYPQVFPEFYVDVSAAQGMVVAQNHVCVNTNGEVAHPHMNMWAGSHQHGLHTFVRSLIEVFNGHPPLRSRPAAVTSSLAPPRPPLPSIPVQHPGNSYPPGPVAYHHSTTVPPIAPPAMPMVPMMLSHISMRTPPASLKPPMPAPPPPSFWEQRLDPQSGRPYYVNSATGQSVWDLPPEAKVAPPVPVAMMSHISLREPKEAPPPSTDELVYNFLFEAMSTMAKATDAAAEALSAKQRQLQAVLADSQKMQELCLSYRQHTEQATKYERECQQLLPQLERDLKSLDTLVLPPSGSLILQKMSEEQADSACTKALAVQGPLMQLHDSKKMNLEQYLRCVGTFAQRKFKAKYILRKIRESELKNTHAAM